MQPHILLAACLLWAPLSVVAGDCAAEAKRILVDKSPDLFGSGSVIKKAASIPELERQSLKEMSHCERCPQVPFGFSNGKWLDFKALIRKGDCLVYFRSGDLSWAGLYGREGYALFRGNAPIAAFLVMLS